MIRSGLLLCVVLVSGVATSSVAGVSPPSTRQDTRLQGHVDWVVQSLTRMQTIKAGMTRADLVKVFTVESGGIQTGRVFVFRDCPYFKVSIEWEPTGRVPTGTTLAEREAFINGMPTDVIKTISRPYIQGMIIN